MGWILSANVTLISSFCILFSFLAVWTSLYFIIYNNTEDAQAETILNLSALFTLPIMLVFILLALFFISCFTTSRSLCQRCQKRKVLSLQEEFDDEHMPML